MNIYMLIDRSGSMASKWNEAISAVNGYVGELANKKGMKKSKATVAVFDGVNGLSFDIIRDGQPIKEWNPITKEDAIPRGMTPLNDAIGKFVGRVEEDKPKKATVAIMTDGYENCSREMTRESAKAALDRLREKKFDVVFLGADFDAFSQSAGLGGASGQTMTVTTGNYKAAMKRFAARTANYDSTGVVYDWSDEDRAAASGS